MRRIEIAVDAVLGEAPVRAARSPKHDSVPPGAQLRTFGLLGLRTFFNAWSKFAPEHSIRELGIGAADFAEQV